MADEEGDELASRSSAYQTDGLGNVPQALLDLVEEALALDAPLESYIAPNGTKAYRVGHMRFIEDLCSKCTFCKSKKEKKKAQSLAARARQTTQSQASTSTAVVGGCCSFSAANAMSASLPHQSDDNDNNLPPSPRAPETDEVEKTSKDKNSPNKTDKSPKKKKKKRSGERSVEERQKRNKRREERRNQRLQNSQGEPKSTLPNDVPSVNADPPPSVQDFMSSLSLEEQAMLSESEIVSVTMEEYERMTGTTGTTDIANSSVPLSATTATEPNPKSSDSEIEIVYESASNCAEDVALESAPKNEPNAS